MSRPIITGRTPRRYFTSDTTAACGTLVNATVTYQLNVLIYQAAIPLVRIGMFPLDHRRRLNFDLRPLSVPGRLLPAES